MIGRHNHDGFWYNPKNISAGHAQITAGISGLALAILLLIFQTSDAPMEMYAASLFFVFSLAFGIISSFEYSVVTGLNTSDDHVMVCFFAPSVAFGTSASIMFVGFTFVAWYVIRTAWFGHYMLAAASAVSLMLSLAFVLLTGIDTIIYTKCTNRQLAWRNHKWFSSHTVFYVGLLLIAVILLAAIYVGQQWLISLHILWITYKRSYFLFMLVFSVMNLMLFEITVYTGIQNRGWNDVQAFLKRSVFIVVLLATMFFVFVVWTLLMLSI